MRGRLGKEPVTEGLPAGVREGTWGYTGEVRQRRDWEDARVVGVHEWGEGGRHEVAEF